MPRRTTCCESRAVRQPGKKKLVVVNVGVHLKLSLPGPISGRFVIGPDVGRGPGQTVANPDLWQRARSADMRYTGSVSNAFVQSLAHNFEQTLRLMETALTDCPDELWQTDLWPDEAPTAPTPHGGLHGSAPWFLGYHALNTLDYDLAGEFEPWAPPQPFDDNTYGFPNRRFTKPELLGYVDWCRGRVRQTLDGLTEEMAARPLPSAHRYHGMLFAVIVGSMPLHVVEHASQIRQFLTAAGLTVQPMPGDRGYTG
jgi:hypothetical protein